MLERYQIIGDRAEKKVFDALATLPSPWRFFASIEWRGLNNAGEKTGEADAIVFHPDYGMVIFEIKAGRVKVEDGQWHYASGPMSQSPYSQARRNYYAIREKLSSCLGVTALQDLTITYAVWFPDIQWTHPLLLDIPDRSYIFDQSALIDPAKLLTHLFRKIQAQPVKWTNQQQLEVKKLFAPSIDLRVQMGTEITHINNNLITATEQQLHVLKALSNFSRLLVTGGAGSGKTILAMMLAKQHAKQGKRVLFTCYNRSLAQRIAFDLQHDQNITVLSFHELVLDCCKQANIDPLFPQNYADQPLWYREGCIAALEKAVLDPSNEFDTIIVDEAADFSELWWLGLEQLLAAKSSWYCFYDINQSIYQNGGQWQKPFEADEFVLTENLRNTRPIGELACELSHFPLPDQFLVNEGIAPVIMETETFEESAKNLKVLLKKLIHAEGVLPEQITVLSPYLHTNPKSSWSQGLLDCKINNKNLSQPMAGHIRVGTIQGFKGLESDVVILVGIDKTAFNRTELLYVGATRAKAALYLLFKK